MAVFGVTSLAVDTLRASGFALKGTVVRELAQMLAAIIAEVQVSFTGATSYQDGMHSRLRGALRTAMDTAPCPLGGSEEELADWARLMVRRTESIASTAIDLWDRGEPAMPEFDALTRAKKEIRAA
jgi:putative RecB family exonuclease